MSSSMALSHLTSAAGLYNKCNVVGEPCSISAYYLLQNFKEVTFFVEGLSSGNIQPQSVHPLSSFISWSICEADSTAAQHFFFVPCKPCKHLMLLEILEISPSIHSSLLVSPFFSHITQLCFSSSTCFSHFSLFSLLSALSLPPVGSNLMLKFGKRPNDAGIQKCSAGASSCTQRAGRKRAHSNKYAKEGSHTNMQAQLQRHNNKCPPPAPHMSMHICQGQAVTRTWSVSHTEGK